MTYCRQATLEDVEYLSTRLRATDVYEIWAASGYKPLHGLMESFASSDICRVFCTAEDEPLCIHGTAPTVPGTASAWLLGTDKLKAVRRDFLKHSKIEVAAFHRKHPFLFNYVWEGNRSSIAWLTWLGGSFIHRYPEFGHAKVPFLHYLNYRPSQCASQQQPSPS